MIGVLESYYTLSDLNQLGFSGCMLVSELWLCESDSFNRDIFEHYLGDIDGQYYLSPIDLDETSNDDGDSDWWQYAYDDDYLIYDSNIETHGLGNADHEMSVPLLSEQQVIWQTDNDIHDLKERDDLDTLESNSDVFALTRNREQLRNIRISSHKDDWISIRYQQILYGKTIFQQLTEIPLGLISSTLPSLSIIFLVFLSVMFSVCCCGYCFQKKRVIRMKPKLSESVIKSLPVENFGEYNLQSIVIVIPNMPMSITH